MTLYLSLQSLGAVGLFCVFPSQGSKKSWSFSVFLAFYLLLGGVVTSKLFRTGNICSMFWKRELVFLKNKKIGSRYWDEVRRAKDLSVTPMKGKGQKWGWAMGALSLRLIWQFLPAPWEWGSNDCSLEESPVGQAWLDPCTRGLLSHWCVPSWEPCDVLLEVLQF